MKAYKLIWKLLRHPFANVWVRGVNDYKVGEVIYNRYCKEFLILPPISLPPAARYHPKVSKDANTYASKPMTTL